ncbi:glycosyltransferase family 2 protein [Cyanobacteria bacterium FACHB-63]|nr:glycosyltransferase family 2 protein [Cyanobacteria bacterium FACHB-63]
MLAFVIPLKSAKASASWQATSKLFERTVRSICNQTVPDFRVFVICHEQPVIDYHHPNIEYLSVDSIPATINSSKAAKRYDKNFKLIVGVNYALKSACSHIMFVDADDCVSRRLASFVKISPEANGWLINQGYEYCDGSSLIRFNQNLHNICGSTNIIRSDLLQKFVQAIDLQKMSQTLEMPFFLHHRLVSDAMNRKGLPLQLLPFPGTVYVKDNGENMTGSNRFLIQNVRSRLGKLSIVSLLLAYKAFTSQALMSHVCEDFHLYPI